MQKAVGIRAGALCLCLSIAATAAMAGPKPKKDKGIELVPLGHYESGETAASGSEIAAYDKKTERLFITNVPSKRVDVVNISNPNTPVFLFSLPLTFNGAAFSPNSVATYKGLIAVAAEALPKTDPGRVFFFTADGTPLASVKSGALPDMVTFTPDGKYALVANEGEPNSYGMVTSVNPEGSVSIIRIPNRPETVADDDVVIADFSSLSAPFADSSIRAPFGPGATLQQDLEPEYIAVSDDSKTAWITLQEANAIIELDIKQGTYTNIFGLGFKDHSLAVNKLDGSDEDLNNSSPRINITNWPVLGMYLPDAVAAYKVQGRTYLVTANEGDSRSSDDFPGFSEEARVKNLTLDPSFDAALKTDNQIGRLTVSTVGANINPEEDNDIDRLFAFGARSFSIWTTDGVQVFDSADDFEQITAEALPAYFNSTNDSNTSFDTRSDNKGPEPEGVVVEKVWGRWYAFITLERIGGVMVYDVTEPSAARFVQYINTRDFSGATPNTQNDMGPEGILVIPENESPTHQPLLVVCHEISGTTRIFQIEKTK